MPLRRLLHYVVIAAGYALGAAALWVGRPREIPPSWHVMDGGDIWLGGAMVAFLLPTASAVTFGLQRCLHPWSRVTRQSDTADVTAVYDAIVLQATVFIFGIHVTVLAGLFGVLWEREWAGQIVPILLGFVMIGIGNLLPKTRPNLAIGIRTRHTLSDRTLWIRVHRSAGYIAGASWAVIVLSAIAVPRPVGPGIILVVGPAALVGTWLLVRSSRKDAGV